jgi:Tfp pilus assembly protein PilO
MRRLTAREITIVALGAGLAIVVILGLGVFRPAFARLQAAQQQVAASSAELAADTQTADLLPSVQKTYDTTAASLQHAEDQIPQDIQLPQIVALLVQGIDKAGGQLVGMEFPQGAPATPVPGTPGVVALQFTMSVRGTWPEIVSFLHSMETLPRLISIDDMNVVKEPIGAGVAATATPTLRADLTMRAFALH